MRLASKLVFLSLLTIFAANVFAANSPASKQPLRVLYIGNAAKPAESKAPTADVAGPERMADFKQFLEKNFTSVTTIDATQFTPESAKDADVIVVDAKVPDGIPRDFRRPMIVIGVTGQHSMAGSLSKVDWL
jgi:hypothetical protein